LGWEAWLSPRYTPIPYMCYLHVKFGSSATKGVGISRKNPKLAERRGPAPLRWEHGDGVTDL